MLTDALASSQFAIAGKLTGHDAIVIRGRAPQLSVLLVDGGRTRLLPARHLAARTAAETETKLRDDLGRGWRMAAIGPAGERGVRYATVSHDGRHAGRGAVMGAKNLKAIAVRSAAKVATADPASVLRAARDLRERSFGPATAKYRAAASDGTPAPRRRRGGSGGRGRGRNDPVRSEEGSCPYPPDRGRGCGRSGRRPGRGKSSTRTRSCSPSRRGRPDARRGACRSSRTTRNESPRWYGRPPRNATC